MVKKFIHAFTKQTHENHHSDRLMRRFILLVKISFLMVALGVGAIAASVWWFHDSPLVSPITNLSTFHFLQEPEIHQKNKKIIYGYLPYWNVKKVTIQPELTHLAYFALAINPDGTLQTKAGDGGEPGYNGLKSEEFLELSQQMKKQKGAVEIVLTQFNPDETSQFLASLPAQEKLFQSLDEVILAYPVNGVNIDIESGTSDQGDREHLTRFMQNLRNHLNKRFDKVNLSIAMYASASSEGDIWDVSELAKSVDYLIVMAYDFHRRDSQVAGPVAPLFGGKKEWDSDINQHLQALIAQAPREKILLGVPFYGYEWQTTSREAQSHTFPDTGSTVSIDKVADLLAQKNKLKVEEKWNEDALSPYLSYTKDGEIYVLYYENSRSISYKLDYVNQLDLGGIAIWALGYDGSSRELWDVIKRKF